MTLLFLRLGFSVVLLRVILGLAIELAASCFQEIFAKEGYCVEEKKRLSNVGSQFHIYTESVCIGGESIPPFMPWLSELECSVVKLAESKVILTAGMGRCMEILWENGSLGSLLLLQTSGLCWEENPLSQHFFWKTSSKRLVMIAGRLEAVTCRQRNTTVAELLGDACWSLESPRPWW